MLPFILGVCMLNGLASPWLPFLWGSSPIWLAGMTPGSIEVIMYLSSLALSTLTLMVSGIPAALYERFTLARESTNVSLGIWLGGAALLTLPAVPNLIKLMGS